MPLSEQAQARKNMIARFFDLLYPVPPEGGAFCIWTLKRKLSRWATTKDAAIELAWQSKGEDTYLQVCLGTEVRGRSERCPAEQVLCVPGLYADVDIIHPTAHRKAGLPPTKEAAQAIVNQAPWGMPSFTVHTGHGIQAYWLFQEPWVFTSDEDRQEAARLLKWTEKAIHAIAARQRFKLDSVSDLARVLRVPGTTNCKDPKDKLRAIIIQVLPDPHLYDPEQIRDTLLDFYNLGAEEFRKIAPEDAPAPPSMSARLKKGKADFGVIILNAAAEPPAAKFDALWEFDLTFRETWKYARGFKSQSEYDLSLASFAAQYDWSPQEITDLIIAHRRRHKQDNKALRQDYIMSTLLLAIQSSDQQSEESEQAMGSLSALQGTQYETPESKAALLETLSTSLGIGILRVVKFLEEPPVYMLTTHRGDVEIGDIKQLIIQLNFRAHVAAATNHVIPNFPSKSWLKLSQALCSVVEEVEVSMLSTQMGQMNTWLQDFLTGKERLSPDDGAQFHLPVCHNGCWLISLDKFLQFLVQAKLAQVTPKGIVRHLRRFGCVMQRLNITVDDKRTVIRLWRLPKSFIRDEDSREQDAETPTKVGDWPENGEKEGPTKVGDSPKNEVILH